MDRFDIKIPEIRCQTPEDVLRSVRLNPKIRERFSQLVAEYNAKRDAGEKIRAEDVLTMAESGERGQSRAVDLQGFFLFFKRNVHLVSGGKDQAVLADATHSVDALVSLADDGARALNRLTRTVQGMMHGYMAHVHRALESYNDPQADALDAAVTERDVPDVKTLLAGADARDVAHYVYSLPHDKRHPLLRRLLDAAKAAGPSASEVMGPWLDGLQIVLTDTVVEDTPRHRAALVRYVAYLQKHHPDVAQPPSREELGLLVRDDNVAEWIGNVSAANLAHYFFEHVSNADRRPMFADVLALLEARAPGSTAANKRLEPLRSGNAPTEKAMVRALQEAKTLLTAEPAAEA